MRAFTLVELLVVVAMLIILVSVLTTAMQPVLAGKEIREASRALNAFVAGSVARAAETNRPAGIWIQRQDGLPNAAFDVFFAEVPPLYAGDTTSAAATFSSATPNKVTLTNSATASTTDFITAGDKIRFVYSGPWYDIVDPITLGPPTVITFAVGNKPPPPYGDGVSVPYQIQRGPRPSPVQPMQLPANTVIDLAHSGIGTTGTEFNVGGTAPVVIMFAPDASVEKVYVNNVGQTVLGTIHLLIGRPDQIGVTPGNLGAEPNENRWISISNQTGRVITTENMGGTITNARQFANSGQSMGGG